MTAPGTAGTIAENRAFKYLKRQGLKKFYRNYHSRFGELDLIMWEANTLVFVEVRYRQNDRFGGALASVTKHKQARLRTTAQQFLIEHKINNTACRFDILCLSGDLAKPEIDWIKNAF